MWNNDGLKLKTFVSACDVNCLLREVNGIERRSWLTNKMYVKWEKHTIWLRLKIEGLGRNWDSPFVPQKLVFLHSNVFPNHKITADLFSCPSPSLSSALLKTILTSSNWTLLCLYCTRQHSASSQPNVNITFSAFRSLRHVNVSPGPLNIKEAKSWGRKKRIEGERR